MNNRIAKGISGRRLPGLPGGKSAARVWGNVWTERAAAALIEEHGQSALEKERLELASAKRARRQKLFGYRKQLEAFPLVGSTAMVDPPR